MAVAFAMPVGLLCLGERENAVDRWAQVTHRDGRVCRLEIGAAGDTDRAEGDAGGRPAAGDRAVPDGVSFAPIRLMCPPTANALSGMAIVPGPRCISAHP